MQSLKDKILEGFHTNVGADPFMNWINAIFKPYNIRYCNRIYIKTKERAENHPNSAEYKVTKADNKSLLFSKYRNEKQSIIVNISEIPEILNIDPEVVSIFCIDDKNNNKNIKFLFGQIINMDLEGDTYINNVLLTVDKKTGTVIDKEIIPKFLIFNKPS